MPEYISRLFATGQKIMTALSSSMFWRGLRMGLFVPYHPEQHYMRGPGPKWREKHSS